MMETVNKYRGNAAAVSFLCDAVNLPVSTYMYRKRNGRPGRKPSEYSMKKDGAVVSNSEIIATIEKIADHPFADFGYIKMTHILKNQYGLIINPKKTYRLMKESGFLQQKQMNRVARKRAESWKISVSRPFEKLEIDIKYIHVHGENRNYYMLNLIDCYTWKLLSYRVSASIRHTDVVEMLQRVIALYGMPQDISLRSDNGSQFISKGVAEFIKNSGITHEFCHVATPQENGYVECFHSIVQRFLKKRERFESYFELKRVMKEWTAFYNDERPHKGCGYKTPSDMMREYYEKNRENIGKISA